MLLRELFTECPTATGNTISHTDFTNEIMDPPLILNLVNCGVITDGEDGETS